MGIERICAGALVFLSFQAAGQQQLDLVEVNGQSLGTSIGTSPNRTTFVGGLSIQSGPNGGALKRKRGGRPNGSEDPGAKERTIPPNSSQQLDGCGSPTTDNPVVLATGEKLLHETDWTSGGEFGLSQERTYRTSQPATAMFGPNWFSSLNFAKLRRAGCFSTPDYPCLPTQVTVQLADASSDVYTHVNGTDGPVQYTVNGSSSGGTLTYWENFQWVLTRERFTYTFNADGYLIQLTGPFGSTITFTYSTVNPSQLTRVTSKSGQAVTFTWVGGRVTSITNPAGGIWRYTYNANGMLETVTSPGPSPDIRIYHYDVARLTGVSINGVRYSTYAWNGPKVRESGLAGGEERDTFVYGANTTTATNAQGQSTTYTFAPVNGVLRLKSTSRLATSSCPAAAASIEYDVKGYVDFKLDWNGVKTDYNYDDGGKLREVISAAGTANQLTQTNTWSGLDLRESVYTGANGVAFSKVEYGYSTTSPGLVESEKWTDLKSGGVRTTLYGYSYHSNGAIAGKTVTRVLPTSAATTTTAFDSFGRITSITNPLGHQTTWSHHNALGWPSRMTDANGVITDYTYDAKGNLVTVVQYLPNGNRSTTYVYNNNRQVTDVAYADGSLS